MQIQLLDDLDGRQSWYISKMLYSIDIMMILTSAKTTETTFIMNESFGFGKTEKSS